MIGFAKKIGMTRLFIEGKSTPVSVLSFAPQQVVQVKTVEKDGYQAVQIGTKPTRQTNKAAKGHVKKHTGHDVDYSFLGEFRDITLDEAKKQLTIADFAAEDELDLTGDTIGRGFTGAVKRWGFHGQPASHGHDHVKAVGSIGARWPQRVLPGKKMAGHMGAKQKTLKNVKVLAIDLENKLLFVNGSIPGANSSYLKVRKISK